MGTCRRRRRILPDVPQTKKSRAQFWQVCASRTHRALPQSVTAKPNHKFRANGFTASAPYEKNIRNRRFGFLTACARMFFERLGTFRFFFWGTWSPCRLPLADLCRGFAKRSAKSGLPARGIKTHKIEERRRKRGILTTLKRKSSYIRSAFVCGLGAGGFSFEEENVADNLQRRVP